MERIKMRMQSPQDRINNFNEVELGYNDKEALEEALKEFKGTLLFVFYDRYFINKLADKILYINNKKVTEFCGNYNYFIEHKK